MSYEDDWMPPGAPPTVAGLSMTLQEQKIFQDAFSGITDEESSLSFSTNGSYLARGGSLSSSSVSSAGSKGTKMKPSKKRDLRGDLVEIWMTHNNALEELNLDVKKRYAEVSKARSLFFHAVAEEKMCICCFSSPS